MRNRLAVVDRQLSLIDRARRTLARAATITEIKAVLDTAAAAELYAKRQRLSDDAVGCAHSLQIEALAKLGALLARMPKHTGGRPSKTGSKLEPVRLADLGIDKKISMRAQQIAALPLDVRRAVAARQRSIREAVLTHQRSTATRPPLPRGTFRVLYADPPWGGPNVMSTDYASMSIEELCALNVKRLAADHAVLFLWVTAPMLAESAKVIEAWGFTYKTGMVWDKARHIPGNYISTQHEHLLICTRGRCLPSRKNPMIASVMRFKPSKRHSEKPAEVRGLIERLYGGPYLELFARHTVRGWSAFGNQIAQHAA